jgi:hypothetical protein
MGIMELPIPKTPFEFIGMDIPQSLQAKMATNIFSPFWITLANTSLWYLWYPKQRRK